MVRHACLLCHAGLPRSGLVRRCFLEQQEPGDVHANEHQDGQQHRLHAHRRGVKTKAADDAGAIASSPIRAYRAIAKM